MKRARRKAAKPRQPKREAFIGFVPPGRSGAQGRPVRSPRWSVSAVGAPVTYTDD